MPGIIPKGDDPPLAQRTVGISPKEIGRHPGVDARSLVLLSPGLLKQTGRQDNYMPLL